MTLSKKTMSPPRFQDLNFPLHVFLDTSILIRTEYSDRVQSIFQHAWAGSIVLHTTEITIRETDLVGRRMLDAARVSLDELRTFFLGVERLKSDLIEQRITDLTRQIRRIARHVHHGDGVDGSELVMRFLRLAPPFSKGKNSEFKDAIAALALRQWQADFGDTLLVVSRDSDWKMICEEFDGFVHATLDEIIARANQWGEALLDAISCDSVLSALRQSDVEQDIILDAIGRTVVDRNGIDAIVAEVAVWSDGIEFSIESPLRYQDGYVVVSVGFWTEADLALSEFLDFNDEASAVIRGQMEVCLSSAGEVEEIRLLSSEIDVLSEFLSFD